MEAGTAQFGRKFLAALVAAMLVASVMFLFAEPQARADHIPETGTVPDHCVKFDVPDTGTQSPDDFPGVDITLDSWEDDPNDPDTVNFTISGLAANQWVEISTKSGNNPGEETGPYGNGSHSFTSDLQQAISHVTLCVFEGEPTTTTTEPEETTTTQPEETTTTQPEETTTTQPEETTTTVPEETTTTTLPPEILGLVIVTVDSTCTVTDDQGEGEITVTISVPDGATVVISDSQGAVIDTVTSDATITVPEGATYTWEATVSEGSEFPVDFVPNGELDIESCTPVEVDDVETLPFTGVDTDLMAIVAASLGMLGGLVLLATRKVEDV